MLLGQNVVGKSIARPGTAIPGPLRTRLGNVYQGVPTQKKFYFSPDLTGLTVAPQTKARRSDPTWVPLTNYTLFFEGNEEGYLDNAATGATKFYRLQITVPPVP